MRSIVVNAIVFFSDNGPVFDINPIIAVLAPGLTHARGSTAGLTGSKTSAREGGIRVPASILWKGVLDNSKSDQYIFVQDLLPTLLSAAEIEVSDKTVFDGTDKWQNLITGDVVAPNNDFVGTLPLIAPFVILAIIPSLLNAFVNAVTFKLLIMLSVVIFWISISSFEKTLIDQRNSSFLLKSLLWIGYINLGRIH
mgnify:CR=1 FL=1